MPQSKLVLVTGATGKQGGAVVEALLTRGHQVRALTRNSASPAANRLRGQGVEIAVGDFTDQDSLVRAARGADAVYAILGSSAANRPGNWSQSTARRVPVSPCRTPGAAPVGFSR